MRIGRYEFDRYEICLIVACVMVAAAVVVLVARQNEKDLAKAMAPEKQKVVICDPTGQNCIQ